MYGRRNREDGRSVAPAEMNDPKSTSGSQIAIARAWHIRIQSVGFNQLRRRRILITNLANRACEMPVMSKDVQDSLVSVPDAETVGGLASSELTSKRNLAFRFSLIRQKSRRHCA